MIDAEKIIQEFSLRGIHVLVGESEVVFPVEMLEECSDVEIQAMRKVIVRSMLKQTGESP